MITANTVRQSTEGGWWDPPLIYLRIEITGSF